jgi:NAD-dependent DNA ligase
VKQFLDYASAKYYADNPVISDDEFDKLAEMYNYQSVGYKLDLSRALPHTYRMYSLNKYYEGETSNPLPSDSEKIDTLKLDGAAAAVTYINGVLVQGLTRGDGISGLDILNNIATLVPKTISTSFDIVQIVGEVVAPKNIPNARNYASGALSLQSVKTFMERELTFVAYGVQPYITSTFYEDMGILEHWGFRTVCDNTDLSIFPQDGIVYRLNNNEEFDKAGFTAKHPKGAYALKTRKEGIVTTLREVIWQVGRTGVVSPVAIFDPVILGEAKVSRATLHNFAYIQERDLEIGCSIEVVRSGEIIPRVVRRVYDYSD